MAKASEEWVTEEVLREAFEAHGLAIELIPEDIRRQTKLDVQSIIAEHSEGE